MKILIQNGRVIDPASGLDQRADVAIAAGRIVAIGLVPADFSANRVINAQGASWRRAWWTCAPVWVSPDRSMPACSRAKWPLRWPVA